MAVIVLVVLSATNLLISAIRSNVTNINTLIAYGLAQEGLEAARNIRDSDWLLGASFNGVIGKNRLVWGVELPVSAGYSRYYIVDYNEPGAFFSSKFSIKDSLTLQNSASWKLQGYAPWKLRELKPEDIGGKKTVLYKKETGTNKEVHYTHDPGGKITPFRRFIIVTPVQHFISQDKPVSDFKKMRVASVVEWEEFGRKRQVRLDTELTDWKETY